MGFPRDGNPNRPDGVEREVVGRPREESRLVDAARQGDARAYEELLRMHEDVAFRTAYVITGSAADAEEAVQDAFVKAHRALGRFRRDAPFRPWLLRIVANEARNRRRSAGRRLGVLARAAAEDVSGGAAPSPETQVVADEGRRRLFDAIGRLREEERLAIVGRYVLGLTDEETAAALGVRRGTVKTRVWRALARLRTELEAEER
jgi:RNA polymerase sigma factor (sigma-70 family)